MCLNKVPYVVILSFLFTACTDAPEFSDDTYQNRKLEQYCLNDPVDVKNFASPSSYNQTIDNYSFVNSKGDFFYLNETNGYRFFDNRKYFSFTRGMLTANIPAGKSASIFYGMKFDQVPLAGVNSSAVLNEYIKPQYQGRITKLTLLAKGKGDISLILNAKNGKEVFSSLVKINDSNTDKRYDVALPELNQEISQATLVFKENSNIELKNFSFDIAFNSRDSQDHIRDAVLFLLSSLLDGFDTSSGLMFETARAQRDRMGYGVPSTGLFSLALIIGVDLGFLDYDKAKSLFELIIDKGYPIIKAQNHYGWLPHYINSAKGFQNEHSVIDTAIFYISLLHGLDYFNLDKKSTEIVSDIKKIDFNRLIKDNRIALGFDKSGSIIPYYYDVVGGEFILIEILRIIATGDTKNNLVLHHRKTWENIGFIPELASLFFYQFGGLNYKDNVYEFNWLQERKRVFSEQKKIFANISPLFGFSECEISTKDEMRRYIQQGADKANIEKLSIPDGFWFTPSYVLMTSLLEPKSFEGVFSDIQNLISPLSSVPECVFYNSVEKKVTHYNFMQIPLRMYFSLISGYHFIRQSCKDTDVIYDVGTKILKKYGILERFFGG